MLRPANSVDLAAIKAGLADRAEEICRAMLPAGRRHGGYWTVGSVQGERGKSLFVRLTGSKRGTWRDTATDQGGSMLDLIMHVRGVAFSAAIAEALDCLGQAMPAPREIGPDPDEDRRVAAALCIWAESRAATGTLAEVYLRGRGVLEVPPTIRFHGAMRVDGGLMPGMVAAVTDSAGVIRGVHRTFLGPDGRKATDRPKRALGVISGGAVHLFPPGPRLGIAEGIETALAASALFGVPVWAMLGSSGLGRPQLPPEAQDVVIFADGDTPGYQAARKAAAYLREKGRAVRIAWAPDRQDFADVLLARGAS